MNRLEKLNAFKIDEAQQLQIKAGKIIYDQTTQLGGGYCTGTGIDCVDAVYNDDGGFIAMGDLDYSGPSPNCP